jgi:hypothetical protein
MHAVVPLAAAAASLVGSALFQRCRRQHQRHCRRTALLLLLLLLRTLRVASALLAHQQGLRCG